MKPFNLVIEAFCTDEHSDSPAFGAIEMTDELLARIKSIGTLLEANGLEQAKALASPTWDQEDDLRIRGERLAVTKDEFWFTAYSKYGSGHFETRSLMVRDLERMVEAVAAGATQENESFVLRDGVIYYDGGNNDVDFIAEAYQAHMAQEAEAT